MSVSEEDFYLITNIGVRPNGSFTAPYLGGLNSGQIYSSGNSAISRLRSPGAGMPLRDRKEYKKFWKY
jgi:hypothetical protein